MSFFFLVAKLQLVVASNVSCRYQIGIEFSGPQIAKLSRLLQCIVVVYQLIILDSYFIEEATGGTCYIFMFWWGKKRRKRAPHINVAQISNIILFQKYTNRTDVA